MKLAYCLILVKTDSDFHITPIGTLMNAENADLFFVLGNVPFLTIVVKGAAFGFGFRSKIKQ